MPNPSIFFNPGDIVTITADGCVQTGGFTGPFGDGTWKRYVNPSGSGSDSLYHGQVAIKADDPKQPDQIELSDIAPLNGKSFKIDKPSYLGLGYTDNDYSDNGYDGHDNGSDDQCDGNHGYAGDAYVEVVIHSQTPTKKTICDQSARPFDLLPRDFGLNHEDVNAQFKWQCDNKWYTGSSTAGPTEDDYLQPTEQCAPWAAHSDVLDVGGCTDQIQDLDYPAKNSFSDAFLEYVGLQGHVPYPTDHYWWACNYPDYLNDKFHGHANYHLATYTGKIHWKEHSPDARLLQDDDYNFSLDTVNAINTEKAPLRTPVVVAQKRSQLGLEFKASETVDHFGHGWWDDFHRAVDEDDQRAKDMVEGHDAVVLGLFGLDSQHGASTEVHPVYALAIRESLNAPFLPEADKWAVFARNTGTEGGCSQYDHPLYNSDIALRLPAPVPTLPLQSGAWDVWWTDDAVGSTRISPAAGNGFADVQFHMASPDKEPRVHGEISLQWPTIASSLTRNTSSREAFARRDVVPGVPFAPAAVGVLSAPSAGQGGEEDAEPEAIVRKLADSMTSQQRKTLAALLSRTPAATPDSAVGTGSYVAQPLVPPSSRPKVGSVVDALSQAKTQEQQLGSLAICSIYAGAPPEPYANMCKDLKPSTYALPPADGFNKENLDLTGDWLLSYNFGRRKGQVLPGPPQVVTYYVHQHSWPVRSFLSNDPVYVGEWYELDAKQYCVNQLPGQLFASPFVSQRGINLTANFGSNPDTDLFHADAYTGTMALRSPNTPDLPVKFHGVWNDIDDNGGEATLERAVIPPSCSKAPPTQLK